MHNHLKDIFKAAICVLMLAVLLGVYAACSFADYYLRYDKKFTSLVGDEWTVVTYGEMYIPDEWWKPVTFGENRIELTNEEIQQLYAVLGNIKVSFFGHLKPEEAKMGEAAMLFEINGHIICVHYGPTLNFDGMGYHADRSCLDEVAAVFIKACEDRGLEYYGYVPRGN